MQIRKTAGALLFSLAAAVISQAAFAEAAPAAGPASAAAAAPASGDGHWLADRHVAKGVKCDGCHDGMQGGPMKRAGEQKREACVTCHGWYDVMAKKTTPEDPDEQNVHSQHDGELDCTVCHKGHRKGVNYCSQCHMWEFKIP